MSYDLFTELCNIAGACGSNNIHIPTPSVTQTVTRPSLPLCIADPTPKRQIPQRHTLSLHDQLQSASLCDHTSAELLPTSTDDGCTSCTRIRTDFSLHIEPGRQVRNYQHELAVLGIQGKNYIVVAPTGSGKTLVAALVISHHLNAKGAEEEERKVVFIVNTKPLAQQQTKQLQKLIPNAHVICSTGEDLSTIKDILPNNDIVVCTAGKLRDDLNNSRVKFYQISLMVIDECHHTRKRHPHAEIMLKYLRCKGKRRRLPQVMGLTASPGAGENRDLEESVTINHLITLCALMDATGGIQTVRKYRYELDQCTNKPTCNLEITDTRSPSESFIRLVDKEMALLEEQVDLKCPFDRWSQEYETVVHQERLIVEKSLNPTARDNIFTFDLLLLYSRALNMYTELQFEDAISILNGFYLCSPAQASQHEVRLKERLNFLKQSLHRLPKVPNPALQKMESILEQHFEEKPASKAIIFVRTKKHAAAICEWIPKLLISSRLGINPRVVTGHTRNVSTGMTQVEQEEAIKSFHNGKCNVLVATSVAEEGIDVPACNLVIRYQHVSNEIAKAQSIGRARATGNSEGYTILSSDSKKTTRELKNEELLALVDRVIEEEHFPTGVHLQQAMEKEQQQLAMERDLKMQLQSERRKTYNPENVQLLCKRCKTPACLCSEIYTIDNSHHVVPGESFKEKYTQKKLSPQLLKTMSVNYRIHCINCDADWGVSCTWPAKGCHFPVLSCKSFLFVMNQHQPQTLKKWSGAPFEIKPLSSIFESFAEYDEDDSDSD